MLELIDYDFTDSCMPFIHENLLTISKLIIKQSIVRKFDNKQQQEIFHRNLIYVIKHFSNLRELEIVDYCYLMDRNLIELGKEFLAKIEILCLDGCEALTGESFGYLSRTCSSLVGFTFICPNNGRVFLKVNSVDLVQLILRNKFLNHLSLMICKLDLAGLSVIISCGHIKRLMLNVYFFDEFISSAQFLEMVMQLLADPFFDEVAFYIDSEDLGCFNDENGSLVLCVENLNIPLFLKDLLIEVFLQRPQQIHSVSFSGIKCLTHDVITCLGMFNSECLENVMISDCGNDLVKHTVEDLFLLSGELKLVFVMNGSESLGSSGRCYSFGKGVLAILDEGETFTHSELAGVRTIISSADYDFLHSTQYCSCLTCDESIDDISDSDDLWDAISVISRSTT